MADFIIKPTSGNLILKDDQNVARITVAPTSGNISLGTVTSGTIGSGVSIVSPAGYVHQTKILKQYVETPHVYTNVASMVDSGIHGSFTTRKSADDSMLLFDFYTGMRTITSGGEGYSCVCLTTSSNTTYAEANDIQATLGHYPNRFQDPGTYGESFQRIAWYNKPTSSVPSGLASYTAEQTLYARVFFRTNSTSYTYYLVHSDSSYIFTVTEVEI